MKVRMLFQPSDDPSEWPYLVASCDEYTEDAWGELPDFWCEAVKKYPLAREMIVRVPDVAVINLFKVPTVDAHTDGRGDGR